jgi:hypothetical protein
VSSPSSPLPPTPASPTGRGRYARAAAETRFWSKVDKQAGDAACWLWTGHARGDYGHGGFWHRGRQVFAHVFSWALEHGSIEAPDYGIPDGMVVRHWCHQHGCVRPSHLQLGTQAENIQDKVDADRQAKGETQWASKLTGTQVREIRARFEAGEERLALAAAFNVSGKTVWDIVKRRSWRHIR